MPRHCVLTVRAHSAVTSAATAQTLQSLRVHCSDTGKVTARSLRRHCALTSAVTAQTLKSLRVHCAFTAQSPRAHCSDTARSLLSRDPRAAATAQKKTPRAPHCARSSLRRYHVSSHRSYLCTHCAVVTAQPLRSSHVAHCASRHQQAAEPLQILLSGPQQQQ